MTYINLCSVDFLDLVNSARCERALSDACEKIGEYLNLPYFNAMRLPIDRSETLRRLELFSNWPVGLVEEYDRNGLLRSSPIVARLKSSTDPIVFTIDEINDNRADGQDNLAKSLFYCHGFKAGLYFSVHSTDGTVGAVSFVGQEKSIRTDRVAALNCIANAIFSKATSFRSSSQPRPFGLTKRETECLDWASQGKTSGEMSQILGLSEHTVNHYLISGSRKMDAVSRVHAVSKALRFGVIQ